ncbi:hypothetical protein D9M68_842040 [compost metagenome]
MQDADAGRLEFFDEFLRAVTRRFDDLDSAIDDRLHVFGIGWRIGRRKDGEVYAEGLIGHTTATFDFGTQRVRRRLSQRRQDAEPSTIGNGGC